MSSGNSLNCSESDKDALDASGAHVKEMEAASVAPSEALLAFGLPLPGAGALFQLSEGRDLTEAASRLFEGLRDLDRAGARGIAVMPVPETGLGAAINDRLRRAAAPR